MSSHPINDRITLAGVVTLFKAALLGLAFGEIGYLSLAISTPIGRQIETTSREGAALALCGMAALAVAVYSFVRSHDGLLLRVVRSRRADLFLMFLVGLHISISFGGIGSEKYQAAANSLNSDQLLTLLLVPLLISGLLVIRGAYGTWRIRAKKQDPFFISDEEKASQTDDLLDVSEGAARFAERVFNGASTDSVVFGIDAPWGIGKSSFVNFCTEYWETKHASQVIVFKFNLLQFADRANLLEKFVDGLVQAIQKHSFVPEIRPLISRYSQFIKAKSGLSQFGLSVESLAGTYTVDDAFDDLASALKHLDSKIIVVIDDLDRLSFSAVKDVLFAIKKSFTLPNISYVLCYDTENIAIQGKEDKDAEKVREFLEKFINVKISLFVHAQTLSKYISGNFEKAVQNNLQIDPLTLGKLKQTISAITDIYKSESFYQYQPFLGDIRKLKRLINTLVLLEIEKTDFDNSDFDKKDLIHLLLVYINFPSIFRKIYNTETDGRRGFFSLVTPYESGYPTDHQRHDRGEYKNSKFYTEFIEELSSPAQRFLLKSVFDCTKRLKDPHIDSVSEEATKTYACFNGGRYGIGGRNLEGYLNLIVKLSKPQRRDQYRFYVNAKNRFLDGKTLGEVLAEPDFAFSKGESAREQFWRVVVNSSNEFTGRAGEDAISYLLDHIPDHSLLELPKIGVGIRDTLVYFLIKLLDQAGWSDSRGGRRENTGSSIAEIAFWIFGEHPHEGSGVLEKLGEGNRGPLGLYDLLLFRLSCSADRQGDNFNLQNALSTHGDPSAPTSGGVIEIAKEEMREISQRLFAMVDAMYISRKVNLFKLIDGLSVDELAGKSSSYIYASVSDGSVNSEEVDRAIGLTKSRMVGFIFYQLGNARIDSGVGCGYYDQQGNADKHDISELINNYMFNVCFDPSDSIKNYEYFLDYLLINFSRLFFNNDGIPNVPSIEEFTKVLDKSKLAAYWALNNAAIKALNLPQRDKKVISGSYTATYKDDLRRLYDTLDKLIAPGGT